MKSSVCDQFMKTKTVNPRTGRTIKIGGPVYKALMKECEPIKPITTMYKPKSPVKKQPKLKDSPKDTLKDICGAFIQNKLVNPRTGRKIIKDGPTYKKLIKECDDFLLSTLSENEQIIGTYLPQASVKEIKTINKRWFNTVNDSHFADRVSAVFMLERLRFLRDAVKAGFSKISSLKLSSRKLLRLFFIIYQNEIFELFGVRSGTLMSAQVLEATE